MPVWRNGARAKTVAHFQEGQLTDTGQFAHSEWLAKTSDSRVTQRRRVDLSPEVNEAGLSLREVELHQIRAAFGQIARNAQTRSAKTCAVLYVAQSRDAVFRLIKVSRVKLEETIQLVVGVGLRLVYWLARSRRWKRKISFSAGLLEFINLLLKQLNLVNRR